MTLVAFCALTLLVGWKERRLKKSWVMRCWCGCLSGERCRHAAAGHMQVCTSLQTDNHTSTPPLSFFTGRVPLLPPNQQRQSTEGTVWVWTTHTHTHPFNGLLSGTTQVGRYQKKHSPTHTHPDHQTSFIIFLHLQRSMASSLFILRAWQSSRTTSLQVLFGLLGLNYWNKSQ